MKSEDACGRVDAQPSLAPSSLRSSTNSRRSSNINPATQLISAAHPGPHHHPLMHFQATPARQKLPAPAEILLIPSAAPDPTNGHVGELLPLLPLPDPLSSTSGQPTSRSASLPRSLRQASSSSHQFLFPLAPLLLRRPLGALVVPSPRLLLPSYQSPLRIPTCHPLAPSFSYLVLQFPSVTSALTMPVSRSGLDVRHDCLEGM